MEEADGPDRSDRPSERFNELLRSLASEHENEVRRLREEVARLREDRGEDEVEKLRAEVVRLQQYRAEPKSLPSREINSSWLPLCRGCRDGSVTEAVEEDDDRSDISQSHRDMPVVILEPALSSGGWAQERENTRASAARQSARSSYDRESRQYTSRLNGSTTSSVTGPAKGRLSCGTAGVPWDATGDTNSTPEWKDPTLIALELDGVCEDQLDLAKEREMRRQSKKSRGSEKEGDLDSVMSEPQFTKVTEASPMECWRMFIAYARGHAHCKTCWIDAVANWKKTQQSANASLELGKMITILVPRNGNDGKASHEAVVRSTATATEKEGGKKTSRCDRVLTCLEVLVSHPNSRRRILWDMLGVLLLMHDLIMLPMSAFNEGTAGLGENYSKFLRVFDLFSACFWTSDVMVSFLTGYFTPEGFTEVRLRSVARHYVKSWFPLDMFIVSVDWVSFGFSGLGPTSAFLRLGKTVSRFMRVLRLLRFMKLNTTLRDLLAMINSEYVLTLVNLMKILLGMVIMNHYIACVWYYLSVAIQADGVYHTWVAQTFGNDPEVRIAYAYSTSLHWSLTQFTPASMEVFPENEFERFFNIVVIIFALVIFSSFVSGITQAMTHIRNINSARMAREGEIRVFLSSNKITVKLASRIWRCVRQNNTASLGQRRVKSEDIPLLRMLPEPIKEELRQEVYVPVLNRHPLFREYFTFDPDVVCRFCTACVSEVSLRSGDHAVLDWTHVKELVFVIEGTLDYMIPGCDEPEKVNKGEWACEACLWATRACLDGPMLAGASGADIIKVDTGGVQKLAETHPQSSDFLGRYAKLFIHHFNNALLEESSKPLFNDPEVVDTMIGEVLKQCGKARGLSSRRKRLSGKDLAGLDQVSNILSFTKRDSLAA